MIMVQSNHIPNSAKSHTNKLDVSQKGKGYVFIIINVPINKCIQ